MRTLFSLMVLGIVATPLIAADEAQNAAGAASAGTPSVTQPAVPPPPGPEVMKPVEHGFSITPEMARAIGKAFAFKLRQQQQYLTADQQPALADALAKRLMESARANQEQVQKSFETVLAMIPQIANGQEMTQETAREFGAQVAPLLPIFRDLFEGVGKDVESVAGPDKTKDLKAEISKGTEQMSRIEEQMNRWAQGGYKPGEKPFDVPDEKSATQPEPAAAPKPPRNPDVVQAEQQATWMVDFAGPSGWAGFISLVRTTFKLSKEQNTQVQNIFKAYQEKAKAIMTPEWKQTLRANRTQYNLRNRVGEENAPYFYHLQKQYEAAVQPLNELGNAFRAEVLGVVTPEQRAQVVADLRKTADLHGLVLDAMDEPLLSLAATQPAN